MAYTGESYKVRAELNSKAQSIVLPDGTTYQYQAVIYCPLGTQTVEPGTRVLVTDEAGLKRIEGIVKGCVVDQFNMKIWV